MWTQPQKYDTLIFIKEGSRGSGVQTTFQLTLRSAFVIHACDQNHLSSDDQAQAQRQERDTCSFSLVLNNSILCKYALVYDSTIYIYVVIPAISRWENRAYAIPARRHIQRLNLCLLLQTVQIIDLHMSQLICLDT